VKAHPLAGGSIRDSSLSKDDSDCDCDVLDVDVALDRPDPLASPPGDVTKDLASVMTSACAFQAKTGATVRWRIDRLGPWQHANAQLVLGQQSVDASPVCDPEHVNAASKALVDSVVAAAAVPGVTPDQQWPNAFTDYVVSEGGSVAAAAHAVEGLARYAPNAPTLSVDTGSADLVIEHRAALDPALMTQLRKLLLLAPGMEMRSSSGMFRCTDCDALPDPPDPALTIIADAPAAEVNDVAAASGVDTLPSVHDGHILLVAESTLVDHSIPLTEAQIDALRDGA